MSHDPWGNFNFSEARIFYHTATNLLSSTNQAPAVKRRRGSGQRRQRDCRGAHQHMRVRAGRRRGCARRRASCAPCGARASGIAGAGAVSFAPPSRRRPRRAPAARRRTHTAAGSRADHGARAAHAQAAEAPAGAGEGMAPRRRVRLRSVALAAAGGAPRLPPQAGRRASAHGLGARAACARSLPRATPLPAHVPRTSCPRVRCRICQRLTRRGRVATPCAPPACAASAALVACALLASSRARAISDVIVPMGDLPPGAGVNKATRELIDAAVNGADAPAGVAR